MPPLSVKKTLQVRLGTGPSPRAARRIGYVGCGAPGALLPSSRSHPALGLVLCTTPRGNDFGSRLTALQVGHPRQEERGKNSYLTTDCPPGSLREPSREWGD